MNNPLKIDLGSPKVRAFAHFTYSRAGIRHAQAIDGTGEEKWLVKNPPTLDTPEEEAEFDEVVMRVKEAKEHLQHEHIHPYLKENVWIIAGEFCGGTKYVANFLQKLGVTAQHEHLFGVDGHFAGIAMIGCQDSVEVSGGAALWLPMFPDVRAIWLTRHPVDTINSQYYFKERTDGATMDLQRDMLCRYTMIFNHNPRFVWRVESLPDQLMALEEMGLEPSRLKPGALESARGADRNAKKRANEELPMTWDKLCEPLRRWAIDLGYNDEGLVV